MSVCILDDDWDMVRVLQKTVGQFGFRNVRHVRSSRRPGADRQRALSRCPCDLKTPEMDGLAFLQQALQRDPGVFVILTTGLHSIESAIDAIRARRLRLLAEADRRSAAEKDARRPGRTVSAPPAHPHSRAATLERPRVPRHRRPQPGHARSVRPGAERLRSTTPTSCFPDPPAPARNLSLTPFTR